MNKTGIKIGGGSAPIFSRCQKPTELKRHKGGVNRKRLYDEWCGVFRWQSGALPSRGRVLKNKFKRVIQRLWR